METPEINVKMVEGVAVIYPGPHFNQLRGGEAIESRCQQLLEQGVRRIAINCEETELINSLGISTLLGVLEAVNDARGVLTLSNLSSSNRELLEMLGLMGACNVEV